MIDVKGDLPNLLLAFPSFAPQVIEPWVEPAPGDPRTVAEIAAAHAAERQQGLAAWNIGERDLQAFAQTTRVQVITPGSTAGTPLHVLSSLENPVASWQRDPEAARASLSAAVSLLLRLLDRNPDPASSRDHVLLAERRLRAGLPSDLASLLEDVTRPPVDRIGVLPVDKFLSKRDRADLAAALNTLLASPTFAAWREGIPLDIATWLTPANAHDTRTPAIIISVAHLDDDERTLVLGVLLEEILTWVRSLPGSKRLRALIVFDEVYGFLPPHPANPPTKRPIVSLMKQARAFGVGVVIATQNPMVSTTGH